MRWRAFRQVGSGAVSRGCSSNACGVYNQPDHHGARNGGFSGSGEAVQTFGADAWQFVKSSCADVPSDFECPASRTNHDAVTSSLGVHAPCLDSTVAYMDVSKLTSIPPRYARDYAEKDVFDAVLSIPPL